MTIVKDIVNTFKPAPPRFKVSGNSSSGYYAFNIEGAATTVMDIKDPVVALVNTHVIQQFDADTKTVIINRQSLEANALYRLTEDIRVFIHNYSGSKNPKATSLFQWYKTHLNVDTLNKYPELQDKLVHLYRYIQQHKHDAQRCGTVHNKNAVGILMLLMQQYEAKGLHR